MENAATEPVLDTSRPHMARVYDYFLGGKNHFAADREVAAKILQSNPATREVLDLSRPTALIMLATLHLIQDEDRPAEIIATLIDALPSGSFFAASHITMEHAGEAIDAGQRTMRDSGISAQARDSGEFGRLAFSGLELVPPGVVLVSEWRATGENPSPAPEEVNCYGGGRPQAVTRM